MLNLTIAREIGEQKNTTIYEYSWCHFLVWSHVSRFYADLVSSPCHTFHRVEQGSIFLLHFKTALKILIFLLLLIIRQKIHGQGPVVLSAIQVSNLDVKYAGHATAP